MDKLVEKVAYNRQTFNNNGIFAPIFTWKRRNDSNESKPIIYFTKTDSTV